MDAEELRLFSDSLRLAIERRGEGEVDAALADVDWYAALGADPRGASRVVFDILGERNLASCALDDLLTYSIGLDPSHDRVVVLPAVGSNTPPATYSRAEITVAGLACSRAATAEKLTVIIDAGEQAYVTTVDAGALDVRPIEGLDPAGGWHRIDGQIRISSFSMTHWEDVLAAGQLALAQQLTSASRAMLGLAREHALSRNQFDRPIASFQAVRHKLAECLVAVEGAEAALHAGWDDPTPFAAAMAKSIAGTTAKTVAKHAQQVLAGMGFTEAHPFHHYLKRTMVLDQLLGSSTNLRRQLGQAAVDARTLPPLLPL